MIAPTKPGWVGASSVAKIMAKGQGKTRESYLADIVACRLTGQWPESYCNDAMLKGIELEDTAADIYSFLTDNVCEKTTFIPHQTIEWFGCTPDRLVGDDGLVEIKTVKPSVQIKYLLADKVPSEYVKQVQTQLLVTGRKWVDFVSYCSELGEDHQIFIKRVEPDLDMHKEIDEAVKKFLSDVEDTINKLNERKR